ncbi:MAG: nitroreductase family protein [Pseudomonas sp.]|uniref:nitroreductase family protein n=1 Tax=Pseudomonas sp. TaxID=306 RepID=UPI003398FCBB
MTAEQPSLRDSVYPIDPQFIARWSPRAFTAQAIDEQTLLSFFEAARWAPSSFNSQPWRFLYARRDSLHWQRYLELLSPFNRSWAQQASALVVVLSKTTITGTSGNVRPAPFHTFDSGAAWAYLALQASLSGWHAHGLGGFDKALARQTLGIPGEYEVEIALAIGKQADKQVLPEDLQAREQPSPRLPLAQLVSEGDFAWD